jgi:invasion protein IalB
LLLLAIFAGAATPTFALPERPGAMEIFFPLSSSHAVALQPGINLVLDSTPPRPYPYRSCSSLGCFAEVVMDEDFARTFVNSGSIEIQATDIRGTRLSLPVSMKGFEAAKLALDRMQQ